MTEGREKLPKLNLWVVTASSIEWAVKLIGLYAAGETSPLVRDTACT